MLLYAQPATRITQLKTSDMTVSGDQVLLQIAEEELPLPEPLDHLITTLITQRRNMGTAANPSSPWLGGVGAHGVGVGQGKIALWLGEYRPLAAVADDEIGEALEALWGGAVVNT
ncbi:hypothetical protein ACWEPL_64700 [Nonomuraea sp. NPDC004186]